ncbi:DUF4443 domain-containing protein [Candidatus Altiarchaeota archaeon]
MVGAAPSFSEVHLIRALLLLHNSPMGRKRLVKELGLGEGSVRTILKRLWADGLVESYRGGQKLSRKGGRKASSFLEKLWIEGEFHSSDLSEQEKLQVLVIVKKIGGRVKSSVALRDQALRAGADGAVIIAQKKGDLIFPPDDTPIDDFPDLKGKLDQEELRAGDCAIICWAKTREVAEDGALTIALELLSS